MFCNKCGNKILENAAFCNKCGNKVSDLKKEENNIVNNNITNLNNGKEKNNKSKNKLVIILVLLFIILILIIVAAIVSGGSNKANNGKKTIMIYMAGSDLESRSGVASSDLDKIVPEEVDLSNINVLLYTGSTKKWHNFANEDENALYILKKDGFEKLESYEPKSLGDSDVFKSFLNYSYDNYKADSYNLIFWNHGLGALGSISDEDSNDFLSIKEMETALKTSKFNKKNKIDTILFRTCLNGTYEVASVLSDYSNYMIASEEVTIGSRKSGVLNFINDIEINDDGVEYGKKFISSYKKQVDDIDIFGTTDSTYSILNLNKMDELEEEMDKFFSSIDVKDDYNEIARIRNNLHQYAVKSSNMDDYDTVDLYELVTELESVSDEESDDLIKILDEMIVYNWATNDDSHGLSIYFPFNGAESIKNVHLSLYNALSLSNDYTKFIKKFNNIQDETPTYTFSVKNNETKISGKEFSLKLTEDQVKNYAGASYIIFNKTEDNYYVPLYSSSNAKLKDDGTIVTNISNNLIKVVDKSDNSEAYIQAFETSSKKKEYITTVVLNKITDDISDFKVSAANMHLKISENKEPIVTKTTLLDRGLAGSAVVNYKDYTTVQFTNYRYKILDENGNYNENWEGSGTKYLYELKTKNDNINFKTASLDDSGEYYCVFKIKDVKNNYYYSNLIKIN